MPLNIININALQTTLIVFFTMLTIGGILLLGYGVKNYIQEEVAVKDFNKDKNRAMLYGEGLLRLLAGLLPRLRPSHWGRAMEKLGP